MTSGFNKEAIEETHLRIFETLRRVEAQTVKINGTVAELQKWKYISMGAVMVLSILVVPLLSWALYTLANINVDIQRAVDEALEDYEINQT